ncbi:MAG: hypothetical protein MJ185_11005 [Treponema sp.]|nr:hypothetical protein [Treponema sp.]
MKKIAKILSLSILAAALFVGCSNPADPDATDTSDTTPKTDNTDNGSTDNAGNNGSSNNGSNEGNGSGNEDPQEEVLFTLDFSGAELPENDYNQVESNNDGKFVFTANECLTFNAGEWKEFSISPKNMPNIGEATKIKVTYKTSGSVTFGDTDNDRFMVGVICQGGEDVNWATTNLSWTAYYDASEDGAAPTEYTTVTKNINWEEKYKNATDIEAPLVEDFSKVKGVKLYNTNMTSGKLHIKSVSFIK